MKKLTIPIIAAILLTGTTVNAQINVRKMLGKATHVEQIDEKAQAQFKMAKQFEKQSEKFEGRDRNSFINQAVRAYDVVIADPDANYTLKALSHWKIANLQYSVDNFSGARKTLKKILNNYTELLDSGLARKEGITDKQLGDDAYYLAGQIAEKQALLSNSPRSTRYNILKRAKKNYELVSEQFPKTQRVGDAKKNLKNMKAEFQLLQKYVK